MTISGFATKQGTEGFKKRFEGILHSDHFRLKNELYFSSIGIGSYLGNPDESTDLKYEEALKAAVKNGVNVIDAAINYRAQRSERSFGKAIRELIGAGQIKREELILCTKAGFVPLDGSYDENPAAYIERTFVKPGIIPEDAIIQGCHCLEPAYLDHQLQCSLKNLGIETIDIFYLHNPETQLAEVERPAFLDRIKSAFVFLEDQVKKGTLRMYGTATWNGYRVAQNAQDYLSVEELAVLAREAGGAGHHFKAVQLPFNLAMPEAWILANQPFAASAVPFLGLMERMGLITIASASLLQSRLTGPFPDYMDQHFKTLTKSSQRAIQFTRSVPGITTALVGMKTKEHVRENLETAKVPALTEGELFAMFQQH